jgi:hypothetical protein
MKTATQGRVFTILHIHSEREDMNTATQGRVFTILHMRSEIERTLPHRAGSSQSCTCAVRERT